MAYRVLHLITRLDLGGAQQNTLFSVANHDRDRFEVELIAGRGGYLDPEARRTADARVELVPYLEHPIAPLRDLWAVLRLRDHFRRERIDLVHTHSSKAGIVGRLAAFLAGVPVVLHTVHGWSFNDTQPGSVRRLYAWLERVAGKITDRLIVVTDRDRDKGLAHGIGTISQYSLVRSGIDPELYRRPQLPRDEMRAALGFGPEHFVVGTMSCLKPQKAPLDFVGAAAEAYYASPHMRFFIAGDGELRPDVEALIEKRGVEKVVKLLGWRTDVVDLLHAMDCFLLTSRFEGLPRAVLQAMAAGVPVVATAVDGTPEVVENGVTGVLVPPGEPKVAAERLVELAAAPERARALADEARRRLGDEFDIRVMVRELDRLYLSLLEA
jgi:glycosyltransferase involved in cell wall biosynthesis